MGYTLDQFTKECRDILKTGEHRDALEKVRDRLSALLMEDDFVAAHCGPDTPPGTTVLYEDPELGFQVLSHAMRSSHESLPHDHGASWAIYGQAAKYTDMTDWERFDDGSEEGRARIEPARRYRLERGEAGIFADHAIHSIAFPAGSRFVRVTGVDLEKIKRARFDPEAGTVVVEHRKTLPNAG